MKIPLARYSKLPTEQQNPRTLDLDRVSLRKVILKINREDASVPKAVAAVAADIEKAARLAAKAYSSGGRIIFIGAGTSGRLGVLEASECPPTYGTAPERIIGIMAGGNDAVFKAKEGAEDDAVQGGRDALKKARRGDCVIGIAASGITPYVIGALDAVKKAGCFTVLVTCNSKPEVKSADVIVAPKTGPEALSGSTRMKAGTATKLVLNSITTGAMVSIGKAYKNWMVDLRPTSRKLVARAQRLVMTIADVPQSRASRLLDETGYDIKASVVMALKGVSRGEAAAMLAKTGGFLKDVIE
ncbi:MAG: N-acetylmuramic acid 6-phosphate etherase [Elusimicrobiales bacterium]|nr:N-acetylmuramic acid 6-phosphate etherase [Elusimicrobiales bacterium]